MIDEQSVFLSVISDYLHDRKSIINDVDWKQLYRYSQAHQLTTIVYSQCRNCMPTDICSIFQKDSMQIIAHNVRCEVDINSVLSKLKENGVKACLVKGFTVSEYYPIWQHRSMGDADIITKDRDTASSILKSCAFLCEESSEQEKEYIFRNNYCEIELHNQLEYESDEVGNDKNKVFFNSFDGYINDGVLDISFHFLYLFLHLRKHLMKYGVGFRQFLDIAVLTARCKKINWTWVVEKGRELDLLEFIKTVLALNERWFGIDSPIPCASINDAFACEATEYIFNNGVFGQIHGEDMQQLRIIRAQNDQYTFFDMLKNAFKMIFLNYHAMCSLDYCGFLRKHPLLLPYAWLKRICLLLRRKGLKKESKKLKHSFVSKNEIQDQNLFFEKWGLL